PAPLCCVMYDRDLATSSTPHVLAGVTVFNLEGTPVRLGELWGDRGAVLMFVRHFGCMLCRQQIAEIEPYLDRIRASGAELLVVGSGSVDEARAFRDERRLRMPLVTDPALHAYRALGMRRGLGAFFTPAAIGQYLRAMRQGFAQSRVAGDAMQQGGVVVIAPGGSERYRHVSRFAGDHPDPAVILAHCEAPR
nr:AhpC/TSA family protein [Acidobacteriota bacterium]